MHVYQYTDKYACSLFQIVFLIWLLLLQNCGLIRLFSLKLGFILVGILQMFVHTSAMTDPHRLPLWYLVYLFILCFHVSFLFAISPSPSLIRISHPFVTASQGPPHLVLFHYFFTFCLLIKLLFACTYVDSFVLFAPIRHKSPIFTFPLQLKHPFMHFFRTTLFNDR